MTIAIIQARIASTRFPGKVLKKILGRSVLEHYLFRVKHSKSLDKIVVATTVDTRDDAIESLVERLGVSCFRGSETDLLDRYYQCAKKYGAETVVRLTSDNPFVDYRIIERALSIIEHEKVDLVTNHFRPTYPEGLDIEVYSFEALQHSWRNARKPSEREHVFPYIYNHRDRFRIINFTQDRDWSRFRLTMDYECDYQVAVLIYQELYRENSVFLQEEIVAFLEEHPEIVDMNSHIKRKEGVDKSIAEDGLATEPVQKA